MIKLGRSFWWIIFLAGVSFIISRLPWLAQNPIYTRLWIAFLVVLVVSIGWASSSMWGISLYRSTRTTRKQVGDVFAEDYEIINQSFIPKVWIKVTDMADILGGSGSRVLTGIGGRQSRSYIAYSLLHKRGWFTLGPTKVESGDVFGLFLFQKTFENHQRLLVIPYMVDIQFFSASYGILPGGHTLREKTLEVTPYAAGVREYVPGDPLKRIHWPSSARKQVLIVKEFEKDPLAEVWIFLDAGKSTHIRSVDKNTTNLDRLWLVRSHKAFQLPPDTAEYAISIAASIAKYYINQKREVGLVSSGQAYTVLPAERGERQLGKILETLAVLQSEGDLSLSGLVNSQAAHLARGSTVVLITPASEKKVLTIAMNLIHRGLMPVLILIDGLSFGGVESVDEVANQLTNLGVITFIVREGDNIKAVLETPRAVFNTRLATRKF